jgi:probable phosphoglycerate mutase
MTGDKHEHMQLIFARHGESEANQRRIISNRGLPHRLTERGRQQAEQLARRLANRRVGALYASPIARARETAAILAGVLGVTPQLADALREFDCGAFEGRGDEEAWAAHERAVRAWAHEDLAFCLPGGESYRDMRARFLPFVEELAAIHAGAAYDVVLISHGSVLHHMLPEVLENIDRTWPHTHPLRPTACVVTAPRDRRLVCLEWDGLPFDSPAHS